jgi:hypothetical protein
MQTMAARVFGTTSNAGRCLARVVCAATPCDAMCLHARPSLARKCWAAAVNVASTSDSPSAPCVDPTQRPYDDVSVNSLRQQHVNSFSLSLSF